MRPGGLEGGIDIDKKLIAQFCLENLGQKRLTAEPILCEVDRGCADKRTQCSKVGHVGEETVSQLGGEILQLWRSPRGLHLVPHRGDQVCIAEYIWVIPNAVWSNGPYVSRVAKCHVDGRFIPLGNVKKGEEERWRWIKWGT